MPGRIRFLPGLVVVTCALMALSQPASCEEPPLPTAPPATPPACRIFSESGGAALTLEQMIDRLGRADVVLVGERHDSTVGHALEKSLLEGLCRRRSLVALSLEMFERDVQAVLDSYMAGRIAEADFLARSRPWSNYAADYAPLLQVARERHLPVLAANVPRSIAAMVARSGQSILLTQPPHTFSWVARRTTAPVDAYMRAFVELMKAHPHGNGADAVASMYAAQCLKDDTMAESIADYLERMERRHPQVVHVTGAFHVERHRGTVPRLRARRPTVTVQTVILVPVTQLETVDARTWRDRGDFVVIYQEAGAPGR